MKEKRFKDHLKTLTKNPLAIEAKEYLKENLGKVDLSPEAQIMGHVILVHQDYEILKSHLKKIAQSLCFY